MSRNAVRIGNDLDDIAMSSIWWIDSVIFMENLNFFRQAARAICKAVQSIFLETKLKTTNNKLVFVLVLMANDIDDGASCREKSEKGWRKIKDAIERDLLLSYVTRVLNLFRATKFSFWIYVIISLNRCIRLLRKNFKQIECFSDFGLFFEWFRTFKQQTLKNSIYITNPLLVLFSRVKYVHQRYNIESS